MRSHLGFALESDTPSGWGARVPIWRLKMGVSQLFGEYAKWE